MLSYSLLVHSPHPELIEGPSHVIKPRSKKIDVHVFIPSPGKRLVGMMAAVNSIQSNTNASVKFYLLTDTQDAANHIALWLEKTVLRLVTREIIVFNSSWVKGMYKVPRKEQRQQEFSEPVHNNNNTTPLFCTGVLFCLNVVAVCKIFSSQIFAC